MLSRTLCWIGLCLLVVLQASTQPQNRPKSNTQHPLPKTPLSDSSKPKIENRPSTVALPSVTALAFSPDSKTLAVGVYKAVEFWDVETRQLKQTWRGHLDTVRSLVYTRDGKWLAAGGGRSGASGQVRIWDVAAGRETKVLGDHSDTVHGVAFSPEGTKIATASIDKTIKVWEIASGKLLLTLKDHADAVWSVGWSPDGKYLASSSADRSIKVWDAANGKRLYSVAGQAHDDIIYDVEFSQDGKNLISASGDRSAKVWNFGPENSGLARTLMGHSHAVLAATFAANGKMAATASADKTIKLWDMSNGSNTKTFTEAKDWIYAVRFSPDNRHLAAGTWDGAVYLWSVADNKLEGQLK